MQCFKRGRVLVGIVATLLLFVSLVEAQGESHLLQPGASTGPLTPWLQSGPTTTVPASDALVQDDFPGMNRLRLAVGAKRHESFASGRVQAEYYVDIPYAFRFVADQDAAAYYGLPKLDPALAALIGTGPGVDERLAFQPKETPLRAQVSGQFDLRGYLALLGVGQIKAVVSLSVEDLGHIDGDDPHSLDPGEPVAGKRLFERELTASFDPSLGMSFGLQGGSDFEGMSTGVDSTFGVNMQKLNILETNLDFGLDVLLRRGHRYRFVLALDASAGMHAAGLGLGDEQNGSTDAAVQGKAIASFKYDIAGGGSLTSSEFTGINLVKRWNEIWLQHDYERHHLRNIYFPSGIPVSFFFSTNDALRYLLIDPDHPDHFGPAVPAKLNDFSNYDENTPLPPDQPSPLNGLDGLGRQYFPSVMTAGTPVVPPGSGGAAAEGLTVDHFSITLEDDLIGANDFAFRKQIEACLVSNGDLGLLTLITPNFAPQQNQDPWNGSYLLVRDVVIQAVNGYLSWGFTRAGPTGALLQCARKKIFQANLQADMFPAPTGWSRHDNYREAFALLRQAYECVYLPNPISKARRTP